MTGDHLMTTAEVAAYLQCEPKTLRNKRSVGGGPPAIKLAAGRGGAVRYRRRDVDRWLNARAETRTHERAS